MLKAPFMGKYFLNIMDQGSVVSAVSAEMTATNQVLWVHVFIIHCLLYGSLF